MLLIDGDLKALKPDVPMCNIDPKSVIVNCEGCSGQCKVVAKAQLKKVVEGIAKYGRTSNMAGDYDLGEDKFCAYLPLDIWQSLLKEIE